MHKQKIFDQYQSDQGSKSVIKTGNTKSITMDNMACEPKQFWFDGVLAIQNCTVC